jgi:hypothetical protein
MFDVVGRACDTYGRGKQCLQICEGKMRSDVPLRRVGAEERIIKTDFKEIGRGKWIGLI